MLVKNYNGYNVRFCIVPENICGIGIVSDDLYAIATKFPENKILSVIEFYKYTSRIGDIELCIWGDIIFHSLARTNSEKNDVRSLFELSMEVTACNFSLYSSEEYKLARFLDRLSEFIYNAKVLDWSIVRKERNITSRLRPDFIIEIDGEIIPGEAKIEPFNKHHLKQLSSYMKLLKVEKGIAVAPSLNCELPEGISFYVIA